MDKTLINMTSYVKAIVGGVNETNEIRIAIRDFLMAYQDANRCDDVNSYLHQRESGKLLTPPDGPIKPNDIYEELAMTYDQYVIYLRDKYGSPKCDAYVGGQCSSQNARLHRKKDGLFVHHIAEQCHLRLEDILAPQFARSHSFDLQRADNFVYCNYFEHLLLHIKILMDDICVADVKTPHIDFGGAKIIWKELNQYYALERANLSQRAAVALIDNDYQTYLIIMTFLLKLMFNLGLKRCCPIDDLAEDVNGVSMTRIYRDLRLDDYKRPDLWGDMVL